MARRSASRRFCVLADPNGYMTCAPPVERPAGPSRDRKWERIVCVNKPLTVESCNRAKKAALRVRRDL